MCLPWEDEEKANDYNDEAENRLQHLSTLLKESPPAGDTESKDGAWKRWEKIQPAVKKAIDTSQEVLKEIWIGKPHLLKELLSVEDCRTSQWPRMRMNMAAFVDGRPEYAHGELPSHFELVDLPGLDEEQLLPDLPNVINRVLEGCQAAICVCDANALGTDTYKDAVKMTKLVKKKKVPLLILANKMDRIEQNKVKKLCKMVAKDIYDNESDRASNVYGVSAYFAYLSMRLQFFTQQSMMKSLCKFWADKLMADEGEIEGENSAILGRVDFGPEWEQDLMELCKGRKATEVKVTDSDGSELAVSEEGKIGLQGQKKMLFPWSSPVVKPKMKRSCSRRSIVFTV